MSIVPPPVLEIAVEPRSKADQAPLGVALSTLSGEEPALLVHVDQASGQTILSGVDEIHLEAIVDRLRREFKVDVAVGAPQVAYRETISRPADVDYTHKKQTGGSGQYACVKIHLEPLSRGSGVVFVNDDVVRAVPEEYVPAVEKSVRSSLEGGVLAGFPVIDLRVVLTGGAYHEHDTSALAFGIAARVAVKEGLAKAGPTLLEPIMRLEVVTPSDCMSAVILDLKRRHGDIIGSVQCDNVNVFNTIVRLANMLGYAHSLARLSSGRAICQMWFSHYHSVPAGPDNDTPFRPAAGMRV